MSMSTETIKQVTGSVIKPAPDKLKLSVRVGMCRAIFTKYLPPTNVRGARVKAYDHEGNSVTISYDQGLQRDEIYALAARRLCEKMDWLGELVGGGTPEGSVFVFLEPAPASVVIQCASQEDAEWIG